MRKFPRNGRILQLTLVIMVLTVSLPRLASSQALTTTSNQFVPFAHLVEVPCANGGAGEFVLVSGTLHILFHVTTNRNQMILTSHRQLQGATGVGQITGDVYHAPDVDNATINTVPLNAGAQTVTSVSTLNLLGGADNNLIVHLNIHLTVNANGDITAEVTNTSFDCRSRAARL
jgi:hypothetical protein